VDLLSEAQRQELASLATIHSFPARAIVYRAGADADSVFIIGEGAVKSFRDLPSGRRRIAAFLFAHDLFGLAEAGHYVNTVQTITPMTAFELGVDALRDVFQRHSGLELQFLCKAVHALREAQHHTIIVGRKHATGRLAMLLRLLERHSADDNGQKGVSIPMSRSDIANYLGLSLEAVIRASRRLERQGIVDFLGRHHARILNRQRFEALAAAV
jgi:CRP/FNR family transcriptional regulator